MRQGLVRQVTDAIKWLQFSGFLAANVNNDSSFLDTWLLMLKMIPVLGFLLFNMIPVLGFLLFKMIPVFSIIGYLCCEFLQVLIWQWWSSILYWRRGRISVAVCFSFVSCGLLVYCVLSVIGGISDPTVSVPFVSEFFGRNLNFNI